MVHDGEDQHGLQMANLKTFRLNFSRFSHCDVASLKDIVISSSTVWLLLVIIWNCW